jgi:hypothetical protein
MALDVDPAISAALETLFPELSEPIGLRVLFIVLPVRFRLDLHVAGFRGYGLLARFLPHEAALQPSGIFLRLGPVQLVRCPSSKVSCRYAHR